MTKPAAMIACFMDMECDPFTLGATSQQAGQQMVSRFLILSLILLFARGIANAETVAFQGDGMSVQGALLLPTGPGPHPAIVALHGCGGLYGKDGQLSARHDDWAKRLVAAGFAVLFPDSFGSRGAGSQCKTSARVTRPSKGRVDDALAARRYLQSRPDIKGDAISLLGWSNGGSSVLYAVTPQHAPRDGSSDFRKAVAFYPGCRVPASHQTWHARLPLLILIGAADDWTPAAPCESLAAKASALGESVSIVIYPGAYHDFDHPSLPVHEIRGLAYTADGTGSAHTGTDPAARADALVRVNDFLQR